ncbi:MAG: hypothetical protein HRU19_26860 [Pseudobacteriovorax sp.]|nr:hypothetical protein [Pseudobacteriovorax sp.]
MFRMIMCCFLILSCRTPSTPKDETAQLSQDQSRVGDIALNSGFSQAQSQSKELTSIQLSRLQQISHKVYEHQSTTSTGGNARYWDVVIELSHIPSKRTAELATLAELFGETPDISAEQSSINLTKFLPKSMRFTINKSFDEQNISKYGLLGSSDLNRDPILDNFVIRSTIKAMTNCWTTAYEVLRGADDGFMTFFASDAAIMKYISYPGAPDAQFNSDDSDYSRFIKELSWQEACVPSSRRSCPQDDMVAKRNQSLLPGDLLLIYRNPSAIEHAAIYIDNDFYFERTGAKGKNYLYRLVPFAEIASFYSDPASVFRFRRFVDKTPLPDPLDSFGRDHDFETQISEMLPVNLSHRFRPAYQPEVGDARDLGIYEYRLHTYTD